MSHLARLLNAYHAAKAANPANHHSKVSNTSEISSGSTSDSPVDPWERGLSSAQIEARQNVIARLEANPQVQRAFATRFEGDLLVVSLAVRGAGTCELTIPAERVQSADDWAALLVHLDKPGSCV